MTPAQSQIPTAQDYEQAAQDYLSRLSMEHFMEATAQGTQRKITLESLDLVHAYRPDVQVFNELLVQYPRPGRRKIGQVVPDNMVVLWPEPLRASGSYNLSEQPARPFWMLEYVSKYNKRKDYEDNFDRYENELRVPYFLLFYPDTLDLTLYRLKDNRYVSVQPSEAGRYAIPELTLEVGLLDGWVRYWYQGQLLPLPADLLKQMNELIAQLQAKDEQLQAKDAQLHQQADQLNQVIALLRDQVDQRARAQGRQDILEQLSSTPNALQLSRWLAELG